MANNVIIQRNVTKFYAMIYDEELPTKRFERFTKMCFFLICSDFDLYGKNRESMTRKISVSMMKVILFVIGVRYLVSALSRSHYIRALMCDSNYLLVQPVLCSVMMSISAFVIMFITMHAQYREMSGDFCLITFMNAIRHKELSRGLTPQQYRHFIFYANLMTKYLLKAVFWSLVIVTNVFMTGATLLAYMDPNSGFTLIGVIFWSVLTYFWTIQFYGVVSIGFILWFLSAFVLKNRFKQVNKRLCLALQFSYHEMVLKSIKDHRDTVKFTEYLNEYFKLVIFIVYFLATPALLILVYLAFDKDTNIYVSLACLFIFTLVFGVVSAINYMSTWISNAANSCVKSIYVSMSEGNTLGIKINLKLQNFIEYLADYDIGFYCLDLFPMNNHEFFQYLYVTGASFFLIMKQIKRYRDILDNSDGHAELL